MLPPLKPLIFAALVIGLAACSTDPKQPPSDEADRAREALSGYLAALNEGRFTEAAALYGGSLDVLAEVSPGIDPQDQIALLKAACTQIGYQCLKVRSVGLQEQVSSTEYLFEVEFDNPDGSLFVLGPCCGEDETGMPPRSKFSFTVVKEPAGTFRVLTLPVYVP